MALKFRIQELLDEGIIKFDSKTPNITRNPLPQHVNVIEVSPSEEFVNMIQPNLKPRRPRLIINSAPSMTIKTPYEAKLTKSQKPYVYVSDKALQQRQTSPVDPAPSAETSTPLPTPVASTDEAAVITRSGKVVAAEKAPDAPPAANKDSNLPRPRAPTAEEIRQVIRTVRTSDYDIVEQLRRQPAQISLFDLINTSDKHRDTLQKFLAEVHVPAELEVNALDAYMGTMLAQNALVFSDEDVPELGKGHNNALFITLRCKSVVISKVLIDGGSGVNVIPLTVIRQLGIDEEDLAPSGLSIRAFDGAKRQALGEIRLDIGMGPATFPTTFHVMEAAGSFNMLLGRPWIHQAGAVPSTLHQMVRFPYDGKLVTIKGEYEIPVCNEIELPYVGEPGDEPSTAQTLEMVNMIRREFDPVIPLDKGVTSAARYLITHGYRLGQGLGSQTQGTTSPIQVTFRHPMNKTGLGFQEEEFDEGEDDLRTRQIVFVPSTGTTLDGEILKDRRSSLIFNDMPRSDGSSITTSW